MDDINYQRYRPTLGGILDTQEGKTHAREYTATEIIDEVHWLNERTTVPPYPPKFGANT